MDISVSRLVRLIERPGVYVYIRPLSGAWQGVEGHTEGLVWLVKVEERKMQWESTAYQGTDLEALLQEILDKMVPIPKRRPRRRR